MKTKRTIVLAVLALAILGSGLVYGDFVRRARQDTPSRLLACVEATPAPISWTCRTILLRDSFRPDQVAQLNREAGAVYPLYGDDSALAEEMLSLFQERGVDINAVDERVPQRWTALQSMVMDGRYPDRITMLLRHGARPDVRDADGMTALDLARQMQQKHPSDSRRVTIVRLLEEVHK